MRLYQVEIDLKGNVISIQLFEMTTLEKQSRKIENTVYMIVAKNIYYVLHEVALLFGEELVR